MVPPNFLPRAPLKRWFTRSGKCETTPAVTASDSRVAASDTDELQKRRKQC